MFRKPTDPTLTVIRHWNNVDTPQHVEALVGAFVENKDGFICFSPEDLDNHPHNVIGKIPAGKSTVVFTSGETYSECTLSMTSRELMYHPYQGQSVIVLIKEPTPYLEKMADNYVDLCGLGSFKRKGLKTVPEVY